MNLQSEVKVSGEVKGLEGLSDRALDAESWVQAGSVAQVEEYLPSKRETLEFKPQY
jgi:hypothetical protein